MPFQFPYECRKIRASTIALNTILTDVKMMGCVRKFWVVRGIVKPTDKVPLGILPVKAVFIGLKRAAYFFTVDKTLQQSPVHQIGAEPQLAVIQRNFFADDFVGKNRR